MTDIVELSDDIINDWKINYGLDKRSPADAAQWWCENMDNKAPAGAVAALGVALVWIERLRAERDALRADADRLRAALEVYADPSFYHACSFMFDRPTGGFDEDFDYDDEYERDMPGKHARETLAAIDAAMAQKD